MMEQAPKTTLMPEKGGVIDDLASPLSDTDFANDLATVDLTVEDCAPKAHCSTYDPSSVVRTPSPSRFYRSQMEDEEMSDSTIASDVSATPSERLRYLRERRKRFRSDVPEDNQSPTGTNSKSTERKVASAKRRGRGRPPKSDTCGDLAEAKLQLNLQREQLHIELEEQIAAKEKATREARAKQGYGMAIFDFEDKPVADLAQTAKEDGEEIIQIAAKSSNLKGTFKKALKDRALSMLAIADELSKRSVSEETARLQATVTHLTAKVAQMEEEIVRLRSEKIVDRTTEIPTEVAVNKPTTSSLSSRASVRDKQSPVDIEEVIRRVVLEERNFTRSLFENIEERLLPEKFLRPPLATDNKRATETESFKVPAVPTLSKGKSPGSAASSKGKSLVASTKGKKATPNGALLSPETGTTEKSADPNPSKVGQTEVKSYATVTATTVTQTEKEDFLLPSTTPANEWKIHKSRKKGKKNKKPNVSGSDSLDSAGTKEASAAAKPATAGSAIDKKSTAKKKKVPVPPKSAAVVITLSENAIAKGETYETVLKRARENMPQMEVGPARCRLTQTGARIFEFPGVESTAQADKFAEKLREAVADMAKVARPIKCSTLVLSELDETITREEVIAKVAAKGNCCLEAIKAGQIRPGKRGMGTLQLQCPIAAAKAMLEGGRLLIGWSSVSIEMLEYRPMRCFKCLGIGHTRASCPSSEDRTELCFRCGKAGHKSAGCTAKAHCALCAEEGRPAGHNMGGLKCNPPPKKGKLRAPTRPAAAATVPAATDGMMSE